jgi:uncharacterized protein YjbI with pentapeptide repeats
MNIRDRDKVVEHARKCRVARERGEARPVWQGGSLRGLDLDDADLRSANLTSFDLRGASLRNADLRGADLSYTNLSRADLTGAKLPDGRTLVAWQADPLAGLCDDPESVARALAAWGGRTWEDCPLHAALGANSLDDIDVDRRALAATFVALLDGGHLPRPTETRD